MLWPEGDILGIEYEAGSGWVAWGAESLECKGGVPPETLITVPAGLKCSSFTTTILRSQPKLLAVEPEVGLRGLSPGLNEPCDLPSRLPLSNCTLHCLQKTNTQRHCFFFTVFYDLFSVK